MGNFSDYQIGDRAEIKHTISQSDIEKFVSLTGDDNKIHIDKEFASKTSFKKPVSHGMLSASFISTIIGTKIPGDGALWFSQTLDFLLPVRVGDTITISAEVIAKHEKINALELLTEIHNQDKQKVITGKAKVKIVEQDKPQNQIEGKTDTIEKVALVIGSTGGIGSDVAKKLAANGYSVALHYNTNESKAILLKDEIGLDNNKCMIVNADILNADSIDNMVEQVERRLGKINILVNCATIKIPNIKFEKLDWIDLENQININVKANFYLVKKISNFMKECKYGKIVFVTTQYTESTPPKEMMHYVVGKNALNGFSKSLAIELSTYEINVNLVSPGMTETELISDVPEKMRLLNAAKIPLRRLGNVEDVSNVILFLVSDKSKYITGETIRVNGGINML